MNLITHVTDGSESVSDRNAFMMWHKAFNRKAFNMPFQWTSGPPDYAGYKKAIENAYEAVTKGILKNTKNEIVMTAKGADSITDPTRKSKMKEIQVDLFRLKNTIPGVRTDLNDKSIKTTDDLRNKIIETVNPIFEELEIDQIKPLKEVKSLEDVRGEEP